jgi:hypothetical protein
MLDYEAESVEQGKRNRFDQDFLGDTEGSSLGGATVY